ncbi:MAG: hypothetical protein WCT77_06580, partial [Bacteroidota bacterium]
ISMKKKANAALVAVILIIAMLAVPVNMAFGGWAMHSRAGNYIPFDYSYNILQSAEKDAIIFTNGDNDTFPVWYLQDVEGVRRDVRIVNLSLGNTLWYVYALKNQEPWGAKKLPLSFTDESLMLSETDPKALSYDWGEAKSETINIPKDVMSQFTDDPALIENGKMSFTFIGKPLGVREGKNNFLFRVQDKLILDILKTTKMTRPIYFSTTVGPDVYCGLDKFFRNEGMVIRVCPVEQKAPSGGEKLDAKIFEKCLMNIDNSNNFHKEQNYGFKLRNLNNSGVFYDEVHRRLIPSYRKLYLDYATYEQNENKNPKKAVAILDTMEKYISRVQFPLTYEYYFRISKIYRDGGNIDKSKAFAIEGIKECNEIIENKDMNTEIQYYELIGKYYGPYRISSLLYETLGDYKNAIDRLKQLHAKTMAFFQQIKDRPEYQEELQRTQYNMVDLQANIDELTIDEIAKTQSKDKALKAAKELLVKYSDSTNQVMMYLRKYVEAKIRDMETNKDTSIGKK